MCLARVSDYTTLAIPGLDCPLIFTSMALDLSTGGVALLLKALASSDLSDVANSAISEEVRFANPHDLAALLKWTLARLGRFYAVPVPSTASARKGETGEDVVVVQQRGWLDLDLYLHWREEEKRESMSKLPRQRCRPSDTIRFSCWQWLSIHGRRFATLSSRSTKNLFTFSSASSPYCLLPALTVSRTV